MVVVLIPTTNHEEAMPVGAVVAGESATEMCIHRSSFTVKPVDTVVPQAGLPPSLAPQPALPPFP
jgi:hypothetical protein